jgi:diadenosine tetraphosphate (Ap4A) HIT family hydrolase
VLSDLPSLFQGPCWFCLSTPTVAKHLIVSIADQIYLSLPKGELVPQHVLIIPVDHVASAFALSPEAQLEIYK